MSKFIQIATSSSADSDGNETENLYALDDDGIIWWYDFRIAKWKQLPGIQEGDGDKKRECF